MHGVGIVAMGYVMDHLTEEVPLRRVGPASAGVANLDSCAWTRGEWEFASGPRRWNGLQNTPQDIRSLTNHLLGRLTP